MKQEAYRALYEKSCKNGGRGAADALVRRGSGMKLGQLIVVDTNCAAASTADGVPDSKVLLTTHSWRDCETFCIATPKR
jgi:hypothetical protein